MDSEDLAEKIDLNPAIFFNFKNWKSEGFQFSTFKVIQELQAGHIM